MIIGYSRSAQQMNSLYEVSTTDFAVAIAMHASAAAIHGAPVPLVMLPKALQA
jgi:hypothetical protein